MFAALDETLARLYPTRCWSERDDGAAFGWGIEAGEGEALARGLAGPLRVATTYVAGAPDETCDYVYVLCLGRPPSLVDLREGRLTEAEAEEARAAVAADRWRSSTCAWRFVQLARVAAVQEVRVRAEAERAGTMTILKRRERACSTRSSCRGCASWWPC